MNNRSKTRLSLFMTFVCGCLLMWTLIITIVKHSFTVDWGYINFRVNTCLLCFLCCHHFSWLLYVRCSKFCALCCKLLFTFCNIDVWMHLYLLICYSCVLEFCWRWPCQHCRWVLWNYTWPHQVFTVYFLYAKFVISFCENCSWIVHRRNVVSGKKWNIHQS